MTEAIKSRYLRAVSEPPDSERPKTLPPIPLALHVNETPEIVVDCVLESYSVTWDKLRYGGKLKALAEARNVAYWLLRDVTKLSWAEIGDVMKRDHSTALSGAKQVELRRETDRRFKVFTDELRAAVGARMPGSEGAE